MNRKSVMVICVLLFCMLLSGCGTTPDVLLGSIRRNFFIETYEEEYNHYEDSIAVEKDAAKIIVTGQVASGIIDLKIVEDGGQTYEYTITDTLEETIEIAKKHSENWTIIVDFYEDTEGYYEVAVYS